MKEPKLYEPPKSSCWAFFCGEWVKAELSEIRIDSVNPFKVLFQDGSNYYVDKITYENPTEKRLPTKAELVELLKKHPQLKVKHMNGVTLYTLDGNRLNNLTNYQFTLDLGDTFHSFKRDWSEEL